MLHRNLEDEGCYYGVSANLESTAILFQLGDNENQVRVKLTPQEVDRIVESLQNSKHRLMAQMHQKIIENKK